MTRTGTALLLSTGDVLLFGPREPSEAQLLEELRRLRGQAVVVIDGCPHSLSPQLELALRRAALALERLHDVLPRRASPDDGPARRGPLSSAVPRCPFSALA